ncbi:hypothetical protein M8355_22280, partial [Enterobacter hormaechei]|nr:hypothetical protein [Enterobacter hormaechei]
MLKLARRTNGFGMRFIIEDCQKEVIKTQTSSKLINGLGKGLKCLTRTPVMIDSYKNQLITFALLKY